MVDEPPIAKPRTDPGIEEQSAFDLWLDRGLHKLFDDVVQEPIPDELLRLIETDKDK